MELSTNHYTEN